MPRTPAAPRKSLSHPVSVLRGRGMPGMGQRISAMPRILRMRPSLGWRGPGPPRRATAGPPPLSWPPQGDQGPLLDWPETIAKTYYWFFFFKFLVAKLLYFSLPLLQKMRSWSPCPESVRRFGERLGAGSRLAPARWINYTWPASHSAAHTTASRGPISAQPRTTLEPVVSRGHLSPGDV